MTVQTKLIVPFILLFSLTGISQNIQKDTIFLNFSTYKDNCIHKDLENDLKITKKSKIQFNFCGEAILFYNNSVKSDTLCLKHINEYKFTRIEEIEKLEKLWYHKNRPALIKKYGELHPNFDKNGKFETFLIEIINEKQFVIYPVFWRNQRVEY